MHQIDTTSLYKKRIFSFALIFYSLSINAQKKEIISIDAPSKLEVMAVSGSLLNISWKDNSRWEEGFIIERKIKTRKYWEKVGFVPANTTTFQLGGCLANTEYLIRLKAFKGSMYSKYSTVVGIITGNILGKQQCVVIESSRKRQGEGTFIKTKDGNLHIYFGSFSGVEDRDKSRIARKTSTDNGNSWTEQEIIFEDDSLSLFHPSAIRLSKNIIGVAYSKKVMDKPEAQKVFRFSKDEGQNWSEEVRISDDSYLYTTGSHDRFVELSNGQIMHIVHGRIPKQAAVKNDGAIAWQQEEGYGIDAHKEHPMGRHLGTDLYSTKDKGRTWYKVNQETIFTYKNPYELGEYGFYEASLVEWKPGKLAIFGRNATGFLYVSRSSDFGKTWDTPKSVGIQNPLAPIRVASIPDKNTILLIQSPHVDLFGNWGNGPRYILASRISNDGGYTWKNYKELEYDGVHHYAYPSLLFDGDQVHLSYWKTTLKNNNWKKVELAYRKEKINWFLNDW